MLLNYQIVKREQNWFAPDVAPARPKTHVVRSTCALFIVDAELNEHVLFTFLNIIQWSLKAQELYLSQGTEKQTEDEASLKYFIDRDV